MRSQNRKKWEDLNTPQKASVILLGILQISLLVAALLDIRKRPEQEITGGNKRIWTMIVFVNYIGPIAYFLFGRRGKALSSSQAVEIK
ncbi:MAG: PLD nuclease N-terminal domain-containing protein [Anaerolineales bacterium]